MLLGYAVKPTAASSVHCIHNFRNQCFLSLSLQQIIAMIGVYNNLKQHQMEIVAIEKRTFEQMMQRFEDFAKQVNVLFGQNRSNENWLDNKQVCELLKISPRTLQAYRDTGVLPYSQIGRKCYYKATDIEQFINHQQIKK